MRRGEDGGSPEDSDFTWCVVCGRKRGVGDGLRVLGTSGPQPGYSLSCYLPHANHADGEGRIRPEFVWGTLDCPGAFAVQDIDDMRPALTGRMTARVIEPPKRRRALRRGRLEDRRGRPQALFGHRPLHREPAGCAPSAPAPGSC